MNFTSHVLNGKRGCLADVIHMFVQLQLTAYRLSFKISSEYWHNLPRQLNTGTLYWDLSLSSIVIKQIGMIMHVSCRYELYETYTFSFIPWRTLLGHYTSYCILAAVAPIHFFSMQSLCEDGSAYLFTDNFISKTMHMSKRNDKNSAKMSLSLSRSAAQLYCIMMKTLFAYVENFTSFYPCSWQEFLFIQVLA